MAPEVGTPHVTVMTEAVDMASAAVISGGGSAAAELILKDHYTYIIEAVGISVLIFL